MIFAFDFAPIQVTQLLITVLSTYVTELTLVNTEVQYTSPGYVTNNFKFTGSETPLTYAEANTLCQGKGMEMFTTTEDMKILEVFSTFSTTVIWSQLFQHGVTKALVNVDQFIPVTNLADTMINLPEIVAPEKYMYTFK
jgi:hypothetical protein